MFVKAFFFHYLPLLFAVFCAAAVGAFVELSLDLGGESVFAPYLMESFIGVLLAFWMVLCLFRYFRVLDRSGSFLLAWDACKQGLRPRALMHVVMCVACLYLVMNVFSGVKSLISEIVPYQYDVLFSEGDRWLHFGYYPHEILSFVVESDWAMRAMDWLYTSWFFVIFIVLSWQVFRPVGAAGRMEYMVCFCLFWTILGNVCAILMASVGPVFWDHYVEAINPYAELLGRLSDLNAAGETVQRQLYELLLGYQGDGNRVDPNAPSAMPSLHIAHTALIVFYAWRYCRVLFVPAVVYLVLMLIGSVVFAWHYAIDGYVAIIVTYGLWVFSHGLVKGCKAMGERYVTAT